MSDEYAHLLPWVRLVAQAPSQERIRRVQMDRWIGYPCAENALSRLEELFAFPKRTRMPNLILVGATNNGKTMIVEKFHRMHSQPPDAVDVPYQVPVLKVQMPSGPDENRFFAAMLEILGVPDRLNERLLARQETAMRLVRAAGVKVLVIDEIHNMLAGSRAQQRRFLNLLRWLGNELQIPLVAVGTVEALRAVQSDDQLANRFTPVVLPPWQMGPEYLTLLNTLEAVLPLRRASVLSEPTFAQRILTLAEGALGEIITLVTQAAARAIAGGEEMISPDILDDLGFIAPTERRRAAERAVQH